MNVLEKATVQVLCDFLKLLPKREYKHGGDDLSLDGSQVVYQVDFSSSREGFPSTEGVAQKLYDIILEHRGTFDVETFYGLMMPKAFKGKSEQRDATSNVKIHMLQMVDPICGSINQRVYCAVDKKAGMQSDLGIVHREFLNSLITV